MRIAKRAEEATLAGSCTARAANMFERPACVIGQAAPFTLLVAEPSQAGIGAAGQSVIGELVDPLCGSALRRQIGADRPQEQHHRGQRAWKSAHSPSTSASQHCNLWLKSRATMTANWGRAKSDLPNEEKVLQGSSRPQSCASHRARCAIGEQASCLQSRA